MENIEDYKKQIKELKREIEILKIEIHNSNCCDDYNEDNDE